MGIPVGRAYMLAFALGTALAGIAGGLVSVSYSISPSIGLEWTLKALIVIVLAGLGSLFGSFAGGILLGLAEAMSVVFLGGPYREVVGLILFLIVLLVRPQGCLERAHEIGRGGNHARRRFRGSAALDDRAMTCSISACKFFLRLSWQQSWNLLGGYAGQINLGHAAYFGLGALVTRFLWVGGAPLILALFPAEPSSPWCLDA